MTTSLNLPPRPWKAHEWRILDSNGVSFAGIVPTSATQADDHALAQALVDIGNAAPEPPTLTGLLAEASTLVAELRAVIEAARAKPQGVSGSAYLGLDEPLIGGQP